LRVVVSPDQVALWPVQRTLGWRGLIRTMDEPHIVSCSTASGATPWRAALHALESMLPEFAAHSAGATVILSNHFLRYVLVPWRAELADAEEELSYARHCFARVYGKAALQWSVRLSQEAAEAPRLASAVDTELLDGLKGVFSGAGIPLRSIQPHLMAAFNAFTGRRRQHSAWLALLEPGNLCLALLQQGRWSRVRSLRIGHAWREELPQILEREAYLADDPAVPHAVYVWSAELGDTALPEIDPWQFHALGQGLIPGGLIPGAVTAQDRPLAMAMEG
jgi:hypothetical protein